MHAHKLQGELCRDQETPPEGYRQQEVSTEGRQPTQRGQTATAPEYLYEFLAYRLPGSEDSHVLFTLFRWKQLWPFTSCHTSWSDAILRAEKQALSSCGLGTSAGLVY